MLTSNLALSRFPIGQRDQGPVHLSALDTGHKHRSQMECAPFRRLPEAPTVQLSTVVDNRV